MKSITIVIAIVVLLSCSGSGANPGEALGSEKRIQELIKQLGNRSQGVNMDYGPNNDGNG